MKGGADAPPNLATSIINIPHSVCFNEGRGRCPAKPLPRPKRIRLYPYASMKGGADAPPNTASAVVHPV